MQSPAQKNFFFKQQAEQFNRMSFLQNVHEKSNRIQKKLMHDQKARQLNMSAFAQDKPTPAKTTVELSPELCRHPLLAEQRLFSHRHIGKPGEDLRDPVVSAGAFS